MPLLLLLPLFMHHSQLGKMTVMYDNIRWLLTERLTKLSKESIFALD
jgi:hypothetical protein